MIKFNNLHVHSSIGSMLDSMVDIDTLFKRCKEIDQEACAITDHGYLTGIFDAYQASKKYGVKFIPGIEAYFVHDLNDKEEKNKHIVILAQNEIGYKNLLKLNYEGFSFKKIKYGKIIPRISWEQLEKYNEGLIVTSACCNGIIANHILHDKPACAIRDAERLLDIFKNRFYLELQPHSFKSDFIDQHKINKNLYVLHKKTGIPMIATNDVHYLDKADFEFHDMLLAISDKKSLDDPDRRRYINEFYLKSYSDILKYFGEDLGTHLCFNTIEIASRCDEPNYLHNDKGIYFLPTFPVKDEADYEEFKKWQVDNCQDIDEDKAYLRFQCIKRFREKNFPDKKMYWDRIKKEIEVLESKDLSSYILIVSDYIKAAKERGCAVGTARGCFAYSTNIYNDNGESISICDMLVGDKVISSAGIPRKVTKVFSYTLPHDERLVDIKLHCHGMESLLGTLDHKIFGCKAKDISKAEVSEIELGKLSVGDYIFFPRIKRVVKKGKAITKFIKLDEEFMWAMGVWVAGGWVTGMAEHEIGFCINIDKSDRLEKWIKSTGFEYDVIYKEDNKLIISKSKLLYNLWKKIFFRLPYNSASKKFPLIPNVSDKMLLSMFHGFVSRIGIVDNGFIKIRTSGFKLEQIVYIMLCFGIPCIIDFGKEYSIIEAKKNFVETPLSMKPMSMEQMAHISIPITGALKDLWPESIEGITDCCVNTKDGFLRKIKSKKIVQGTRFVYDISVEEDSSYLTTCGAVHNSSAGSMVANLMDVTGIDPIKYNLKFERFVNVEREQLADIDTDFSDPQIVKDYLIEKYGKDHVASIANIMLLKPKVVVTDIARSLNIGGDKSSTFAISKKITNTIPSDSKTVEHALETSKEFRDYILKYPEIYKYACKLQNLPRQHGIHAAGIIISPKDKCLSENLPLKIDNHGITAIQYEKERCEKSGYLKVDLLGLKTLVVLEETKRLIRERGKVVPNDISLDDKKTFDLICDGKTLGVFQLEGSLTALCKIIKPRNIEDISIINALGRPSCPPEEREDYIKRRSGQIDSKPMHPKLGNALKATQHKCIYEEDLLILLEKVCGWSLARADVARRICKGKAKTKHLLLQLKEDFMRDAYRNGIKKEDADKMFEIINHFSGYGFNKSHSIAYATIAYWTAYFKSKYTTEFFAALLNKTDEENKIKVYQTEARESGIEILPPDINKSEINYSIDSSKKIRIGFRSLKGVGDKAIESIIKERPFKTIESFIKGVNHRVVNIRVVNALIDSGCFDSFKLSRKFLSNEYSKIKELYVSSIKKNSEFSYKYIDDGEWDLKDKLERERLILGDYITGTINDMFGDFFPRDVRAIKISELDSMQDNSMVRFEGIIRKLIKVPRIRSGKNQGKKFAIFLVEDLYKGIIEMTVWSDEYKRHESVLNPNTPIVCMCSISSFAETKKLNLKNIIKI